MDEAPQEPQSEEEVESPTVTFTPVQDAPRLEGARAIPGFHGYGLVVERGPWAGMTFLLDEGLTRIGRGGDQDIVLDDVTVSRSHAEVEVTPAGVSIRDVGSTNGTYINGERLDRSQLKAGDEMIIGKYHLILAHGDG
jgi:hypothetical protein